MKKRKELNALIGLGDSKRKKTKKGSGHRLLRTEPPDSESESSSEDDGFSGLSGGGGFGKRSYTQCCSVCYPLFLFIILAACVMACAGLIWMQIALKEDLDSLKEKLHSMETSQKASSSEIPKLSEDLKNKQRKLDELENGSVGLNKLWTNLTEMNRKVRGHTHIVPAFSGLMCCTKMSDGELSDGRRLRRLQDPGSTLRSPHTPIYCLPYLTVSENTDPAASSFTLNLCDPSNPEIASALQDVTDLRKALSEANRTEEQHHTWTDEQIHVLLSTVADLHQRVALLENGSAPGVSPLLCSHWILWTGRHADVNDVTTVKSSTEDPVTQPQTSRRPRFLSPARVKRAPRSGTSSGSGSGSGSRSLCPKKLLLPRVASLKAPSSPVSDLQELFQSASPGLTQQDLGRVLGPSALSHRTFGCFDRDGDGRLSLRELRAAAWM
uniref:EF-hand domain-containing protein n=1 Tax=Salarias fasciatus TaxID=181472 RepID=A0A672HMN8_SALFA